MNRHPRGFLFLLALSAAVALPAFGQGVMPVMGGTDVAPSTPDFQACGSIHTFPASSRRHRGRGPSSIGRAARTERETTANCWRLHQSDLKPEAAATVKRIGEIALSGTTSPTPSNRCWPSGVPYIFFQPGMEMLQRSNQIVFIYLRNHEFRQVRLNELHPARIAPSWYGDSVAHYEGDSLVIDTVGVKADRPFAMVDMYGTPFSSALHVVERYRMVDYDEAQAAVARNLKQNARVPDTASDLTYRGKRLQVIFTVEDEGVFTMPWSGAITYERPAMAWEENVCAENPFDFFAGKNDAFVPTANKPDF